MSRRLVELLQSLESEATLANNKDLWLDQQLDTMDEYTRCLIKQIEGEARLTIYKARGCANIQLVDLLYMLGFNVLQYPVKHLVIATSKGKIPIPSPYGLDRFVRIAPIWRKHIPILTIY